jgi:hypothetical protein
MSNFKIPTVSIVGTGNLTPDQYLSNDLDFLAMIGYRDTDFSQINNNINNVPTSLSNFTVTTNYTTNTGSAILTYSQVPISNTTTSTTYQGQFNIDFNLCDNGIFNNTDPTFSDGYVSVPPSIIHYNVLKYRIPFYNSDLNNIYPPA